jgi:uncharacterized damage-inducible protein DinB
MSTEPSSADLLIDALSRVREVVRGTVTDLTSEQLSFQPDGNGNSIGWLVWHLTRVQDDHVADASGGEQVWTSAGWRDRFDLPFEATATGYGHSSEDVAAVWIPSADLLIDYHDAVFARSSQYISELTAKELARIVDDSWEPPVTLAVRLVSVISDDLQHAGQAAYVKGLLPES